MISMEHSVTSPYVLNFRDTLSLLFVAWEWYRNGAGVERKGFLRVPEQISAVLHQACTAADSDWIFCIGGIPMMGHGKLITGRNAITPIW
jgi:hypothetical protein